MRFAIIALTLGIAAPANSALTIEVTGNATWSAEYGQNPEGALAIWGQEASFTARFVLDRAVHGFSMFGEYVNYFGQTESLIVNGQEMRAGDTRLWSTAYVSLEGDNEWTGMTTMLGDDVTGINRAALWLTYVLPRRVEEANFALDPNFGFVGTPSLLMLALWSNDVDHARYLPRVASITYSGDYPIFERSLPPGPPGIPEPASWAIMILGFGLVGSAMRCRATPQLA